MISSRKIAMKTNEASHGPTIFLDRALLSKLPNNVVKELSSRGLTTSGYIEKASFVGLMMVNNKSYVFLPRGSNLDKQEEHIVNASNTLKAVEKYSRISKTKIDLFDEGNGERKLNKLSLIRNLLDDFRQNGIYTKRRTINKLNFGKTDWKKTVNKISPYPGVGDNPVYLDTYGSKKRYFNDCEIAVIHANVISKLDMSFSWLVTGNLKPLAPELIDYGLPRGDCSYQLSRLKSELSQTYSDRDINLLKLLIQYIKSEAGSDQSNFIVGLSNFHFCWEYMLGQVLNYTVSLNNKLPAPAYIDNDGNVLTANEKSMRTDIILHDEGNQQCTVADAKYYAATTVSNAPGWGDIVKQLFYEKALSKLDIDWKIKNAFVFPGCEPYLAKAKIRDRVNSTQSNHVFIDEFEPIHCYYADPMEVVSKFITGNKMNELTDKLIQ
ncbi:MAG TPA: hypothetical protein DEO86_21635 [Colwellia sp.]|nr:hypothetical protein [Colwellia sp.]